MQPPVLSACQGLTGVVESRRKRPEEGQAEGHRELQDKPQGNTLF